MLTNSEQPVLTAASLVALGAAILALLVAFGIPVTPGQVEAILGLITVVAPFAVALLTRKHVTPVVNPKAADGTPLVPVTSDPEPPAPEG